ncbi:MAG: avirulence protein [Fibrobacter sp.]|nr:avirulence protein [Fibrobacter sp.]
MLSAIVKITVLVLFAVNYLFADVWTLRKPPRSGGDPDWNACYESDHFAVWYSSQYSCTQAQAQKGLNQLENVLDFYVNQKNFCPKVLTRNPNYKINLCIIESGLYGGLDTQGHPGMWMGVGGLSDNWGLAHEFCHALQGVTGGFRGSGRENYVGWFWECHANWMPHQLYPNNPHCTEMYTRMANLYWGSHRCRYCNWQFLEYLKEREGIQFINDIWNNAKNDVIETMMANGGWDIYEFGDLFADFATKNVIWDYDNGATYRSAYGNQSAENKWRRYTYLQELDTSKNRYIVPFEFAPQRYGYNHVRLYPTNGATTIKIKFRGCVQTENNNTGYRSTNEWEPSSIPLPGSDWRYSLVAVTSSSSARYSEIKRFSDGAPDLTFDISGATEVYLVVTATPTVYTRILWDQMYYTIYRYPWMVEITGAKPQGFEPVTVAGRAHSNGGGFVANSANVASTVYVGPFARVLGGTVQGNARIEDRAIIKGGTIRDNAIVKDNAMVAGGTVSGSAVVSDNAAVWSGTITDNGRADGCTNVSRATINENGRMGGVCWVLSNITVSGTAQMLGDGEIYVSKSSGVHYGLVDNSNEGNVGNSRTTPVKEVTKPGPFEWYDVEVSVAEKSPAGNKLTSSPVLFSRGVNGTINLQCALPGNQPASIDLIDIKGRILWRGQVSGAKKLSIPSSAIKTDNLLVWRLHGNNVNERGKVVFAQN